MQINPIEERMRREMPTAPPGYQVGKWFIEIWASADEPEMVELAEELATSLMHFGAALVVLDVEGRLRLAVSPIEGSINAEGNA